MSTQTVSTAPRPTIPPDVVTFAREQGVEQYLSPLIELARRVYPSATRFEVFTEDDPEIPDDRHIVFRLDTLIDLEQAREADYRWHRGAFEIVPARHICVFPHSINMRP
jgi:hypothetical protein